MGLNYKDSNGKKYKVGDIVYNPFFGDYWVVQKCNRVDVKDYCLDNKYCLALYNNKEDYVTEIDVPNGFVIVKRKGDKGYKRLINIINKISKERLNEYTWEFEKDDQ